MCYRWYTCTNITILYFFSSEMFKLNEKCEINRKILECDFIRYSPSEINTINTPNSQKKILIYLGKIVLLVC